MTRSKEDTWQGYFGPHIARAGERQVAPAELLDEEWADGHKHAMAVLRYATSDSDALEIACGVGRVSRHVANHCRNLACADIIPEALVETRRVVGDKPGVSYHKINGYDLAGFEDAAFDIVYSYGTFFHLDFEVVVNYLPEIKRVLRVGGIGFLEFKGFRETGELLLLLEKIKQVGIASYEAGITKFRYVSPQMLSLACSHFDLKILDDDVTKFTFQRIQ